MDLHEEGIQQAREVLGIFKRLSNQIGQTQCPSDFAGYFLTAINSMPQKQPYPVWLTSFRRKAKNISSTSFTISLARYIVLGEKRRRWFTILRWPFRSHLLSTGPIACFGATTTWPTCSTMKVSSMTQTLTSNKQSCTWSMASTTWAVWWRCRPISGVVSVGSKMQNSRPVCARDLWGPLGLERCSCLNTSNSLVWN